MWSANCRPRRPRETTTWTRNGATNCGRASPVLPDSAKLPRPNSPRSTTSSPTRTTATPPCWTSCPCSKPISPTYLRPFNENSSTAFSSRCATTSPPTG
jgi:hypothetical protein